MISSKLIQPANNERGVALLMTMLILVALTLIGTAATRTSTFEIMISGAEKNKKAAFYTAEAGIEHAKKILEKAYNPGTASWNIDGIGDALNYDTAVELISEKSLGDHTYTVKVWDSGRLHIRSESKSVTNKGKSGIEVTYSTYGEEWLRNEDSDRYQDKAGPLKTADNQGEKKAIETFEEQLTGTI